jgi:hypothetical protein
LHRVPNLLLILLLAAHGGGLSVVSTPGGEDWSHDTLSLSLSPGDTAVLEASNGRALALRKGALEGAISGARAVVAPRAHGRFDFTLSQGRLFGRSWPVRVDVLPRRTVSVGLRHAGGLPPGDSALRILSREASRDLAPLRVSVVFHDSGVLALPTGKPPFWDRDGDGRLDLLRNMDSLAPAPELDSLVRWLQSRGAAFPEVVVVGLPNRTGWELGRDLSKGDTLLSLSRRANLPWRDAAGELRSYVVSGRNGERPDTFQVRAYKGGAHRLAVRGGSGMRHPHQAATDWVTLPGLDPGSFGFTPWWRRDAPILAFPGHDGRIPSRSLSRIAAREIARALGLDDHPDGSNLMCPMVRPDLPVPVVTPEQWRQLMR